MNRREFIAASAATQAVAAAPETVTTQFLWIKNVEYAGFYLKFPVYAVDLSLLNEAYAHGIAD